MKLHKYITIVAVITSSLLLIAVSAYSIAQMWKVGSSYNISFLDAGGDAQDQLQFIVNFVPDDAHFSDIVDLWDNLERKLTVYPKDLYKPLKTYEDFECSVDNGKNAITCTINMDNFYQDGSMKAEMDNTQLVLELTYQMGGGSYKSFVTDRVLLSDKRYAGELEGGDAEQPGDAQQPENKEGAPGAENAPENPAPAAAACNTDPLQAGCDPDGDGVVGTADPCPFDAETYTPGTSSPVDGVMDGCPSSQAAGAAASGETVNLLSGQGKGACTLIPSSGGGALGIILILFATIPIIYKKYKKGTFPGL
jgi:hypothetical protein